MNRNSNRRAAALAALSAAALFATTAERSSAQVWNAPNSGNWSDGVNWIGGTPAPGAGTVVTFNASGAQTYSSNNNLANPFLIGSVNFANSGTGAITLTGSAFSGGAATSGAFMRVDSTGTGASITNNGGSLYSMRVGTGSMTVNGGNWTLLSTQRQNDELGTNDGFWSFNIGDIDGNSRFTQTGGTISGVIGGFIANTAGSNSIATFTGASTVMNVTDGRFGVNKGTGTINVLAGAKVNTRLIEAGRSAGAVSNILVDGIGSELNGFAASTAGQLYMGRSTVASSSMTISNGGLVRVNAAPTLAAASGQVILAANPDAVTTLNILSGGQLQMQGNLFINNAGGVAGDPLNTTTFITVDGANSVLNVASFAQNNGTTALTGGQVTLAAQFGGTATMTVSNNGHILGANTFVGNGGVVTGGVGSILLSTGGRYTNSNQLLAESQDSASMVRVGAGSTFTNNGSTFLSTNVGDLAVLDVNGGSFINGGQIQVSGSGTVAGGVATLNIQGNGFVSTNGGTTSLLAVFTPGVVNIGSGTSKGTLIAGDLGSAVDGVINFNAGTFNSTGTLAVGGSVLLSSAGRAANGTASNKKMVEAGRVDMTTTGVIDLNDNDMLLHTDTVEAVQALVVAARNGGLWNQPGITSTAAKNAVPQNKNLGVVSGANFLTAGVPTFNGKTVVAGDTLVKFTFNGDTDLNGTVDFDDYSRVDNGFNNNRTGWFNGDFDYNGVVDFDDYSLIDQAFNTQGIVVLNASGGELAGPGARVIISAIDGMSSMESAIGKLDVDDHAGNGNSLQAVPEPTTLGVIGIGILGALRRRRRHA